MAHDAQAGALLALWNDVDPDVDALYNEWHANEHVPERLTVPGILWARRYAALPSMPGQRYLTLYGLQSAQVLESAAYRQLLAHPTPMSARMRPHLQRIARWVCQLHTLQGALDDEMLCVATGDTAAQAQQRLDAVAADRSLSYLWAERIPDAAPLPWMNDAQDQAISGNWLMACAGSRRIEPAAGVLIYERLPLSTLDAA